MRSGETLLRDGLDYVARARPVRFRAFVPLRGNGVGTACKARGIRVGNDGKACGICVGAALEKGKVGKVFHGDACHGNVERARYTYRYGFGPAAWCLSLSYSR